MAVTDPIADMLTRIRNGLKANHEKVLIPASKMKLSVLKILKEEGYIKDFRMIADNKQGLIETDLKYLPDGRGAIINMKRISKPSIRRYSSSKDIERVIGGMGVVVVSTSKGIMSDRQARKQNCGGEILFSVW